MLDQLSHSKNSWPCTPGIYGRNLAQLGTEPRRRPTLRLSRKNSPSWSAGCGRGARTWRSTGGLRYAKLRGNACVEDIDYRASRGLDRTLIRSLVNDSGWVSWHQNNLPCRSNRGRQELAGQRFGSENLSRWISRALHSRRSAVPRSGPGTG